MRDQWEASRKITEAVAQAIKDGDLSDEAEGMPGSWVFVGSWIDGNGENRTAFLTSQGSRRYEILGLLSVGTVAWEDDARRWVRGD